ncbi:MAG: iron-containing alcohol dehydrogenase [Spirochaetes bacterium]|nr:iron-containing alcohol dehydrogenase [Spirochaetota bacterium]
MFNLYTPPTRVLFGAGQLNNLHKQAMPGKKAAVVISNGKSGLGFLPRLEEQMKLCSVETFVFDKVEANPLKSTVEAGAAFIREKGCDFVVALGGGSVMDAAKVMAMLAPNPGDLWDYVFGGTGKGLIGKNPALPMIAITTTAGTGSEVDHYGVVTKPDTNEKIGIGGREDMFPVIAVVDPELMTSVPPMFTAFQGWDALSHSMEGYISAAGNIMSDIYALAAIENISQNLAAAVKDGNNIEAREKVALGNTLSGFVMVAGGVTSQHSLEHALSAYHQDLPHGAGLAMLSKAYFSHFINHRVCDERFVKMAQVMGIADAKKPMDFIYALDRLQADCGLASVKMSDYGIRLGDFETFAKNAKDTMGGLFLCDRRELSIDDCVNIFRNAYG